MAMRRRAGIREHPFHTCLQLTFQDGRQLTPRPAEASHRTQSDVPVFASGLFARGEVEADLPVHGGWAGERRGEHQVEDGILAGV